MEYYKLSLDALISHFSTLVDPRIINHNTRHEMRDILIISLLAVICGADSWVDIELFGNCKREWLETFLNLPNGIPSHDTFRRFYSLLDAKEFEVCFMSWITTLVKKYQGEIIAIDGKTSRRSLDENRGLKALHLVSAWASENGLVLGQVKCGDKGGEIGAMEALLKVLDLNNVTVTMDAMGCQKKLAAQIIQKGGHYLLATKGNQGMLYDKIKTIFEKAEQMQFNAMVYSKDTQVDKGHGRVEQRDCTVFHVMYAPEFKEKWVGLNSLIKIKSEVFKKGQTSIQTRYYISSLPPDAAICAHAIRQHWGVENSLHWCLDMSFNDDYARARIGNSAENFAVLRRIALNLLKKDNSRKASIKGKRKIGGWDNSFLEHLLSLAKN